MTKAKRKVAWLAIIFSQLLAVALIVGERAFTPVAFGDDWFDYDCAPVANPCPTCTEEQDWQCVIVLNGWGWGDCIIPVAGGCSESQSSCGDDCDCSTPPRPTGMGRCGAVFQLCN